MDFSLAHLSDPHLPLAGSMPLLRQLAGKQVLALLSWRRKRRHAHTARPLAALLADLAAHAPDHLAITGDLINLAMRSEFSAARGWLDQLGTPDRVSVVPGNHDLTVPLPWQDGLGLWEPWMRGDPGTAREDGEPFPFLRRRGPLALIGLCSAIATPVFSAAGRLGAMQLQRLEALLDQTGREGLFRVVLIHHPPVIGQGGSRKALRDRALLCSVLQHSGAELVLHGHHHVTRLVAMPGPDGPIPLSGVPPALASLVTPEIAGWRFYQIAREGPGWRLTAHARRYDPVSGCFRLAGTWTLRPAASRPMQGYVTG